MASENPVKRPARGEGPPDRTTGRHPKTEPSVKDGPDVASTDRSLRRSAWLARLLPGGIRERLFLLIVLALLPALILQAWIYYRHYTTRRSEALQTELEVAQGVATTFVSYLNDVHRQLNTAGQAIITFASYTDAKAERLFEAIGQQYPSIRNVSWVDPKGFVVASSLPALIGSDLSDRDYFQLILAGQSWALGDLMPTGSVTESPIFVIASAIHDDQNIFRGVVAAAVEPTRLGVRTFATERPADGAYAVFDRQGNLVYRSPETPLTWEQRARWQRTDPLLQQAKESHVAQGVITSAIAGDRRVAARVPIPGIDWIAGASRPVRVALGPGRLALIREAVMGLLVTLSAFLFAYVIARTIADPIRRLEREAEAMGEGRIGPPGQPDGPKEVLRLHATMTQMATDLIHRAESLRRSEERFRKLFEADLMGVYVTRPDGTFLDCNDKMVKMLGYDSREEILRYRSTDFYVDPEFRREAVRVLQRDGIFPGREGRLRRKDGTLIYALGFAVLLTDEQTGEVYIQGVAVDVTDRKRAEEARRQSEARLNRAQEIAHLGSWEIDLATNELIWSDETYRIFGVEPHEFAVTQEAFLERVYPDDRQAVSDAYLVSLQEGRDTYEIEHRIIRKDTGAVRTVHEKCEHFRDATGKIIRSAGMVHDITERKQAEEGLRELTATLESRVAQRTAELEQRARQLQKLALELSRAEDRERQRLAEILHDDLQQQLAAAKFHLGLLSNQVKGDAALQEAIAPVEGLIKDAIGKSRNLSHELSPARLYHGDFGEAIEWLANQTRTKHGLAVHMDIHGPIEVSSDPIKAFLFRTAREILFNIVKHANVTEATVRLRRRREQLWLTVRDKGRGFDPKALEQATGFGLLSIRERVELLGGRMKIRSAPGRGSTFLIVVPDDQVAVGPGPCVCPTPGAPKETPLRVLLADDHKVVREGLAALLNEQGDIEVVGQATNGQEAVDLAHALQPDVVVMDVAMPLMEGDEAVRQIKHDMPRTRVVGLSMHEEAGVVDKMRRAGVERYMLKTAPSEELLAAIRGR